MPDTRGKILIGEFGVQLPGEQMELRHLIPGLVLGQMSLKYRFFSPGFFSSKVWPYISQHHSHVLAISPLTENAQNLRVAHFVAQRFGFRLLRDTD